MKRKRHTPEQIVRKLREGDRMLNEGTELTEVLRHLEVSESSWARWRAQYGGMKADEAKRLKELERENARFKKLLGGPSRCRSLADRVQHLPTSQRPRRTHPCRSTRRMDHRTPTSTLMTPGPPNGVPSAARPRTPLPTSTLRSALVCSTRARLVSEPPDQVTTDEEPISSDPLVAPGPA
jgi:hypothetical protein